MTGLGSSRMAGSQAAQNDTFGVLKLTLHAVELRLAVRARSRGRRGATPARRSAMVRRALRSFPLHPARPLTPPRPGSRISGSPPRRFKRRTVFHYTLSEAATVRFGTGPPSCRSALPAGREVHAGRGRGSQRASVCVRHRRPAAAGREIQGEGRGPRPRRQLLRASESEVPDRSLTSHRPRSTLA